MITAEQIKYIMPDTKTTTINLLLPFINEAMEKFEINTPERIREFISQLAHESGQLQYMQEIASGAAYEGRKDLGNINPGDGIKYKGRGLMQVTGRYNYSAFSKAIGIDFVANPKLLEVPKWVAYAAGWFWKTKGCNELADKEDFTVVTKRINGGYNGLKSRQLFYERAKQIIK